MASDYNTNQNPRPCDENSGKNMTPNYGDDPSTPRPNDPLNSRPSEEIPTQNLDVDVPPSTNDLNNINTAGYPMSVKSFDKIRKNYGMDFWWPRVKKTKHAADDDDDEPSLPIHSSNAIPCNAVLNPTISALISALVPALTSALTSALLPLLSNPIPDLALTNPTSAQEFNCLKLKDKRSNADFLATELLNFKAHPRKEFKNLSINDKRGDGAFMTSELRHLSPNHIKVRVNHRQKSGRYYLYNFFIHESTNYDELVSVLERMLKPKPSRMRITYEDLVGDFVILGDEDDMNACLSGCGKLIHLIVDEHEIVHKVD